MRAELIRNVVIAGSAVVFCLALIAIQRADSAADPALLGREFDEPLGEQIPASTRTTVLRRKSTDGPPSGLLDLDVDLVDAGGDPLAAALVSFEELISVNGDAAPPIQGHTNADGRVRLAGIGTGDRVFFVFTRDQGWLSGHATIPAGCTRIRLRVPPKPRSGSVKGSVTVEGVELAPQDGRPPP